MKPSVLQSEEQDKEVLVDRSISKSPVVIHMQHLKLFCMTVLRSLHAVTLNKKNLSQLF